ncbi:MAG: ABC transporter ATP-binding protein [Firmicutes bacterium]|nr:ABC transporter ATP-binding protein [Bacillota bacterium]
MASDLLEVRNLHTHFYTHRGVARAVDGVDLAVEEGATLGVVGESGCGKSVTALSIMRLVPEPPGRIVRGEILFKGRDILGMREDEMRNVRGNQVAMVFQEPMTSLNPVFTVGFQIREALSLHRGMKGKEATDYAEHMLSLVGISDPGRRLTEFPHQLSGGMRQRVMIAMALSCGPSLLIADEPTTALDVTIQAQILDIFRRLKETTSMALLLITHDLGIVYETAERVVVMYAGQVVEEGSRDEVFGDPLHPYTIGLLRSHPTGSAARGRLHVIRGAVPDALRMPNGCRFHPRCPRAEEVCRTESPALDGAGGSGRRKVRCWNP